MVNDPERVWALRMPLLVVVRGWMEVGVAVFAAWALTMQGSQIFLKFPLRYFFLLFSLDYESCTL